MVNGLPTKLFYVSWCLLQGCALSPLLFFLVIEGLSSFLLQSHMDESLISIFITKKFKVTHLIFGNDVLLFGRLFVLEWRHIYGIIELFGLVFALLMNINTKSHMISSYPYDALVLNISHIFGVICTALDAVFKYI